MLIAVLAITYYAGGYVAGRMSRFDGARQGLGAWLIGLVVTLIAIALGVIFGDQYNVLDRVDLPRLPIPTETAGTGGLLTAAVVASSSPRSRPWRAARSAAAAASRWTGRTSPAEAGPGPAPRL